MAGWFRRSPGQQRQRAARGASGALASFLAAPWADPEMPVDEVDFLALDLETTGFDPAKEQVLAAGWVPIRGGVVDLAGAGAVLVAPEGDVGASATVHGLTDDVVAGGESLETAMTEVLAALSGKVLLAHHASLEVGFLRQACERLGWGQFATPVVDTLAVQRTLVTSAHRADPPPGSLRLWTARSRFGLPAYRAHDPLIDALSCAELFLAQVAELQGEDPTLRLKRVLL